MRPIAVRNEEKWVMGLIEAEGYIGFNVNDEKKQKWIFSLQIAMKATNARALQKVKAILGAGTVGKAGPDGMMTFRIRRRELMERVVIPFFEKYPPRGVKYFEFQVFKEAFEICKMDSKTQDEKHELLQELKKKSKASKLKYRIAPVVYDMPGVHEVPEEQVLEALGLEKLKEIYDPWWVAGFVEGDGSMQISPRLQIVFEVGQYYNTFAILALHKRYQIPGKLKMNAGYVLLSTKHPRALESIIGDLRGKLLGMKSQEYSLWVEAYRTKSRTKREELRQQLLKLRQWEGETGDDQGGSEEGQVKSSQVS